MRLAALILLAGIAVGPFTLPAQTPPATEASNAAARKVGTPDGGGDIVLDHVSWRYRNLIGNERMFRWNVGIAGSAFEGSSVVQAADKAAILSLTFIEASSSMKASPDIQKNFDYHLTAEERSAVKSGLKKIKILSYRVQNVGRDLNARQQLFQFAKEMGIPVIVTRVDKAAAADLDRLAAQYGINVALLGRPLDVSNVLLDRSKRIGAAADTGDWLDQGIKPGDGFAAVKERVNYFSLRDRSAPGEPGHDVMLGEGVGRLQDFLAEMHRRGLHPLTLVIGATDSGKSLVDAERNVEHFESIVQPILGVYVTEKSREFPIRGLQNLPPDKRQAIEASTNACMVGHPMMSMMNVNIPAAVREKIAAAIPKAAVTPKKHRKLLVIDACVANMSHNVIPHANLALELMGKQTGAFEPIFSNDFNNLKYPKVKEFDAIFLNSTVGELFPDPEVRAGLLRFVREGGGLALLHGATYASRNWPEFAEMVGAADGPHRVQPATLKVEYPLSPITRSIGSDFRYTDEYYRFYDTGETAWLTREKVHVLLSIDMEKTPDFNEGRPPYIRKDNDYPIAWTKIYGNGRVFNNAMGHTAEMFQNPQLSAHILAAIQFVLGDIDDESAPSKRVAKKK